MDVQTRLIAPICPHYAEHVWKNVLGKDGFVVKAGWPTAGNPNPTLRLANKYLQDTIVLMRKLLQKQELGPKKGKKSSQAGPAETGKLNVGLIYVNEVYDGWKEVCLNILKGKYDSETGLFGPDKEILEELKSSPIGQEANFKQIQKMCMPFLRFKKDETKEVGSRALDLHLPFGEMKVLGENFKLIERQLGLKHLEICDGRNEKDLKKAGGYMNLLNQNPPSPGSPVAIFMTEEEYEQIQKKIQEQNLEEEFEQKL